MQRALWLALALLVATEAAEAQSTATLRGRVVDPSGAMIPGAAITAANQATGVTRSTASDADGNYQIGSLLPGLYRIEVTAAGFETEVVERLTLEVARTIVRDFSLRIGGVTAETTVSSVLPIVERASVSIGQVMTSAAIDAIPLNGRHFLELGLLVPGSVTPPQNGFLSPPTRAQGQLALNTAGNREDTVNFQINGVTLNDPVNNILLVQPPLSAVQEFKMDNMTLGVESSRNSGAVINVATRSGTNRFSGDLFGFFRNDALDARNFFETTPDPAPFTRYQAGGALGGPIVRNRTFFFAAYEGLRQTQGLTVNSVVLSDAQRAAVQDPAIARLVDLLPRPNTVDDRGTARFAGSAPTTVTVDQWSVDVTHALSRKDQLQAFVMAQTDHRPEPLLLGNTVPGFGDVRDGRKHIVAIRETRVFGPAAVNEARAGIMRLVFDGTAARPLDLQSLGIDTGASQPQGLPQLNVAGAFNFGGPSQLPQGRTDSELVLSDTFSYLAGRHSFKAGGELRRLRNDNYTYDSGSANFPNVAAFLAGTANSFTITLGNRASEISQGALGVFLGDSYRVTPSLTIDAGLRYDSNMTPTEAENRFVVFDTATASLRRVGADEDVYRQNNLNFEPRAGAVWTPSADSRTVLRGGYGVHVEQPMTNAVTNLTANPPFATPLAVTGTVRFADAQRAARAAGLAPITVDPQYTNSAMHSWNVNVQREVTRDFAMMAGYIGSHGTHLRLSRNINQPVNGIRPFAALSAASPILPGTPLGNITQVEGTGTSNYRGLWVAGNRRLAGGLQFNASYSWSQSTDLNSLSSPPTAVSVQNSYDIENNRGLSDFDARHRIVVTATYELPWRRSHWYGGWQIAAIVQAQSGNPVNIVTSGSTLTGVANSVRPDVTGPIQIVGDVTQWFDTSVFVPVAGFGNLPRNVVIGPRFENTDLSLTKAITIGETTIQLRADAFNAFNHANFGQPGRVVGSPDFGRITNTRFPTGDSGSSRQIQFGFTIKY